MGIVGHRPVAAGGAVSLVLAFAALVVSGPPSAAHASVIDVQGGGVSVAVGADLALTVTTSTAGRVVQGSVDSTSTGDAGFVSGDGSVTSALEVTSAGHGYGYAPPDGAAVFTVRALAPGEVSLTFTDAGDGSTLSTTLTVFVEHVGTVPPPSDDEDPPDTAGTLIVPPGPEPGVHLVLWGGGPLTDLLAQSPVSTTSLWVAVGGQLVGYVPGAPSFVNAGFLAAFPDMIPPGTPILLVRA